MCGLIVKCAALTVMIHGFRVLGRLAGPRWSALALGLPSTTAVVLCMCGCERGTSAATTMAESSLLGLVAAVALPLAYAQAVRQNRRLPAALAAAVGGYLVVASALGCLPHVDVLSRAGLALLAIVAAASWARRLPVPDAESAGTSLPLVQSIAVRSLIPATFSLVLWIVQRVAGPGWAGLVSTFPSMSLVVLAVTHLEAGPAEASRIARVLPASNASTLAFLAMFHFASTRIGLAGGMLAGYATAATTLIMVERNERVIDDIRRRVDHLRAIWCNPIVPWRLAIQGHCQRMVVASNAHFAQAPGWGDATLPPHWRPVHAASRDTERDQSMGKHLLEFRLQAARELKNAPEVATSASGRATKPGVVRCSGCPDRDQRSTTRAPRYLVPKQSRHRGRFAPRVETLAW